MTLVLHQFKGEWDAPNLSPFCFKTATFLRLAGLDYELAVWTPTIAPNGKAPVVELDGRVIADSSVIINELITHYELSLDSVYPESELRKAHALRRALEEHLYWAILHVRWLDDAGWEVYRPVIASTMPLPSVAGRLMASYLRTTVKKSAYAHGLTRHNSEEIARRAIEDLKAAEAFIGDKDFVLGATPCSVDATVYAFIECAAHPKFSGPIRSYIEESRVLAAYLERVHALAWSDCPRPVA